MGVFLWRVRGRKRSRVSVDGVGKDSRRRQEQSQPAEQTKSWHRLVYCGRRRKGEKKVKKGEGGKNA
jgi:hypothetical protein